MRTKGANQGDRGAYGSRRGPAGRRRMLGKGIASKMDGWAEELRSYRRRGGSRPPDRGTLTSGYRFAATSFILFS